MGDLIIKPESGGSIKLQNNAGTNALVSDNSGNITFAGNTTFSGTGNNLGTVTAGNISNSAIVYPAGHVLQVLYDVDATAQALATGTYTPTDLSIVITPSATSSKILCQWTMMADMGTAEGYGTQLMRDSTVVYESGTKYNVYYGGGANSRIPAPYIHLDSPSSTSAITYSIKISSYSGLPITLNDASNQSHLLIMEIAG